MKKFALIILALICIGCLICFPSFRENGGGDSAECCDYIKEDTLVEMEHPVLDQLSAELDSDEIYDDGVLYGYWFKPHEANAVNIFLHKNNTYEFQYYILNEKDSIAHLFRKGTFTIEGKVIKLSSDDGWDKYFNGVLYYENNGTNSYLADKNGLFYLVKGSD
jgi:hypothetical protein